jgi:AcrR family transcriptional regulator
LATEANVSVGLIYKYFGGKEDLLLATILRIQDAFRDQLSPVIEAAGGDPVEQLVAGIRRYIQIVDENLDAVGADLPGKMHILWADRVRQTKDPPTVNRGKTPPREPLTSGERRAALIVTGAVVGVVAAGALAWALAGNSSTYDRSGDGCVTVTFPSTMGGGLEHACGAAAQEWCRAADARHDAHATAVQTQCRVARILP